HNHVKPLEMRKESMETCHNVVGNILLNDFTRKVETFDSRVASKKAFDEFILETVTSLRRNSHPPKFVSNKLWNTVHQYFSHSIAPVKDALLEECVELKG